MGLFDQIIGAIANPNQQANPTELDGIVGAVHQLASDYNLDPATAQTVFSMVGSQVRSALQEQRAAAGTEQAQAIVNQYSGTLPNPQAVAALFPPEWQARIIQEISQRTGMNSATIQMMLPMLIPIVLNLLKTGASAQNPQQGANPVLNNFLDADGDGDVDVADAIMMAGRYLNK